ncbi:DUF3224 domain-containing protein, partial [Serratia sp. ME43]|uniref:DUF3224 domain-containing protein n=1 Tax=Serratia sp. ME43 TaxID=2744256 RepID=UPI0015F37CC3
VPLEYLIAASFMAAPGGLLFAKLMVPETEQTHDKDDAMKLIYRGVSSLQLTVVPDSGTGELTQLSGTMTIEIDQGAHRYTMDY